MKRLTVSAPGRACLFGEHMDWCGHSVIPAAVDMRTYLEATPGGKPGTIQVYSYKPFTTHAEYSLLNPVLNPRSDLRYVGAVIKAMLQKGYLKGGETLKLRFLKARHVAQATRGENLKDLPVKKGLSSSAAVSVATAAAIDLMANHPYIDPKPFSDQDLARYAELAYTGERKILGINCGQMDQYASALGSLLHIDCRTEPPRIQRLNPKTQIPLVIGDTGQPKDTPRILAWLGKRLQEKEPLFIEGVQGIKEVVEEARKELAKEKPDLYKIGRLMNLNQHYLAKHLKVSGNCPVSPNRLDRLIKAALDAGALGAKLSGSGGGGCMIALCLPEDLNRVAQAIRRAGGTPYTTSVAQTGVKIEHAEP